MNQGATCYLNSLLQYLYHDASFRDAIYEADGSASKIIKEMQSLFAGMQHSVAAAISTKPLTTAFGWQRGQVFEQHDIHELFSVLIDVLGNESKDLCLSLKQKFEGMSKDVLKCPKCDHCKESCSPYLSLSLDLPDAYEKHVAEEDVSKRNCTSLQNILQTYIKPEVLDEDNKWECGGCSEKVCATKAQNIERLPSRLLVHLKRFRFDPTSRRRRKLDTTVLFPKRLQASQLLQNSTEDASSEGYVLTAVMLHTGTALGGHYKAYVMPSCNNDSDDNKQGPWLECNDSSVRSVDKKEESEILWYDSNMELEDHLSRNSFLYDNAYMLVYVKESEACKKSVTSIPENIQRMVNIENADIQIMKRLRSIQKKMVELKVYFSSANHAGLLVTDADERVAEKQRDSKVHRGSHEHHVFYLPNFFSLRDVVTKAHEFFDSRHNTNM